MDNQERPATITRQNESDTTNSQAVIKPELNASTQRRQRRPPPQWLDHFNRHDLKIFFRCWLAAWVAILLVFIQPSLQQLGSASFFAILVILFLPPAGAFFGYLLAACSMLVGMCVAWAWGLATMKAAQAARPVAELNTLLAALMQQAGAQAKTSGQSPLVEATMLVNDGFLLDTRVTTVYFVMGCVFIYALSRLRFSNPKLVLLTTFGTIITDIFLLFGPTLPSFNSTIPTQLVEPGAAGIGLGVACSLLIFPHSTSYLVLDHMQKLLQLAKAPLDLTGKRFAGDSLELDQVAGAKATLIATHTALQPLLAFLPLDFSRCRWSAEDVQNLHIYVNKAVVASYGLLDFHIGNLCATLRNDDIAMKIAADDLEQRPSNNEKRDTAHKPGRVQMREHARFLDTLKSPEMNDIRTRTIEDLRNTTSSAIDICSESIYLFWKAVQHVNHHRWIHTPSQATVGELAQNLRDQLAALRTARETAVRNATEAVCESHSEMFDEDGKVRSDDVHRLPMQAVVLAMVFEERVADMALAVEALIDETQRLMEIRKAVCFWIPSRLQYALSWLFSGHSSLSVSPASQTQSTSDPDRLVDAATMEEQAKEAHRRIRISRVYGSARRRSWLGRSIVGTWKWLSSPDGMYALRMVVVTVATSIPAVLPSSAGFYYRQEGIWGVISAQTCLFVYMSDLILSIVSRGLGTVLGGVMGMVAWYIGSGAGPGNPYGLGAICAVMVAILIWWRLYLPPVYMQASIMTGATFVLVVAYSYDEYHIQSNRLPGVGYTAFWKRLVTVLLGFMSAVIVEVLPSPPSATGHVRKSLANTVLTLSDHYAILLSHWGRTATQSTPLSAVAEQITTGVAQELLSLNGPIALLKAEFTFSPFTQEALRKTQQQCQFLNQAMGRLLDLSASLPEDQQTRLIQGSGMLDNHVIGDVMAVLGLIEQSLRTGNPLPERLPTPLLNRAFTSWVAMQPEHVLTKDMIRHEDYRRYCVATSAYLKLLSSIDNMVLVLKEALGESHVIYEWESV